MVHKKKAHDKQSRLATVMVRCCFKYYCDFVYVNFRVLTEFEMFVDIWIYSFDTWKWLLLSSCFAGSMKCTTGLNWVVPDGGTVIKQVLIFIKISFMLGKIKQWWSTIQPMLTKWTAVTVCSFYLCILFRGQVTLVYNFQRNYCTRLFFPW